MGFAERILRVPDGSDRRGAGDAGVSGARHDLTLFTKGHPEEQKLKIDRSGWARFASHRDREGEGRGWHTGVWYRSAGWTRSGRG